MQYTERGSGIGIFPHLFSFDLVLPQLYLFICSAISLNMEVESVSPSISRSSSRTSPCSTNISESGDSRVGSSIHHTPTQEKAKYITCLLEGLSPGNTGAEIVNLIRSAWALLCPIYFDTEHAAFCYSDDTCNGASVPISVGIDKTLKKKDFIVEIGKRIDGAISARHRTDVAGGTDKSRNVLRIHVAERHDGTEWEAYDISADVFLEEPYTMAYTFNHEVFCKAQVKRIHRQLAHLLSQLCEGNDGAEIGSIQLLNAHDQLEIDSWNRHPPIRKQETFPEALQRQTDLRPEAVAIDGWDGRYTYHELNIVTDKLAEHLLSVAADSTDVGLIPICFEKSGR